MVKIKSILPNKDGEYFTAEIDFGLTKITDVRTYDNENGNPVPTFVLTFNEGILPVKYVSNTFACVLDLESEERGIRAGAFLLNEAYIPSEIDGCVDCGMLEFEVRFSQNEMIEVLAKVIEGLIKK